MARRHVVNYFLEQENLYMELLSNLPDFQELFNSGKLTEEEYNTAIKEIENAKANYLTLSYIMFLLNKPNKSDKEESKINKQWYDSLKQYSREAILDESKDALKHLKQLIKEKKI